MYSAIVWPVSYILNGFSCILNLSNVYFLSKNDVHSYCFVLLNIPSISFRWMKACIILPANVKIIGLTFWLKKDYRRWKIRMSTKVFSDRNCLLVNFSPTTVWDFFRRLVSACHQCGTLSRLDAPAFRTIFSNH